MMDLHRFPILPLDGEGVRLCRTEGVKRNAFPVPENHPLHHASGAVLRHVEQSPGLFLGSSAPIKGEDRRYSTAVAATQLSRLVRRLK